VLDATDKPPAAVADSGAPEMDTAQAIRLATEHLAGLEGHVFDVLSVSAPVSPAAAANLAKIVSKLSPILGNLIEFNTVEYLNQHEAFKKIGKWKRQDPGFPDTILVSAITPAPGFEIKAWFPFATEITARFKDSQNHFASDQTYVVLLAWLPEYLIYGKPKIIDLCIVSGASMAAARDLHYHNPPDYLVLEPEDTSARTVNLQQTNTNGYRFQGTPQELLEAGKVARELGLHRGSYSVAPEYQKKIRDLQRRFNYRLDTNFAKTDRIEHEGIEAFKRAVLARDILGRTVLEWSRIFGSDDDAALGFALGKAFDIKFEPTLVEDSRGPVA
jgi:hypothetical protein